MKEERSKLEEKVLEGVFGKKELKKEEKDRYLGEFQERVLKYLTQEQAHEPHVYPEIIDAIKHPAASKVVINRDVDLSAANNYVKLAKENNLQFKRIDSPDLKGDIALVVVSDHAVEVDNRKVLSRAERLKEKGISDKIIENTGAYLCAKCWNELLEKAPEEIVNYKKLTVFDKLKGIKCICD